MAAQELIALFERTCTFFGDEDALILVQSRLETEKSEETRQNLSADKQLQEEQNQQQEQLLNSVGFAEIQAWTQDIAAQLYSRHGVRPGDHVLVAIGDTDVGAQITSILACLRIGAIFVCCGDPQDPALHERMALAVRQTRPKAALLVAENDEAPNILQLAQLGLYRCTLLQKDGSLNLNEAIMSISAPEEITDFPEVAYVLFTSGSTSEGRGKGVQGTAAGLLNRIEWQHETLPFAEHGARCLRRTPLIFIDALAEILAPLLAGIPLVVPPSDDRVDAVKTALAARHAKVTRMHWLPSQLSFIMEHVPVWDELKLVSISGAPVHLPLVREFQRWKGSNIDIRLLSLYGSTETAADASYVDLTNLDCSDSHAFTGSLNVEPMPIGKPIKNTKMFLQSSAADGTVAELIQDPYTIGELLVEGLPVAEGYLNLPTATEKAFIGPQRFRTGDLCFFNPEGDYFWVGRADSQRKLRGIRIQLDQVQVDVADALDLSSNAVLMEVINDRLLAFVDCNASTSHLSSADMFSKVHAKLGQSQHMPNEFIMIKDGFPLTPSGKVDRNALTQSFRAHRSTNESKLNDLPQSSSTASVEDIVKQILTLTEPVDLDKSFLSMGGDSLLAMHLSWTLRQKNLAHVDAVRFLRDQPLRDVLAGKKPLLANTTSPGVPEVKRPRLEGDNQEMAPTSSLLNRSLCKNAQVLWTAKLGRCVDAAPRIQASKKVAFVGSHGQDLAAIQLDNGHVLWHQICLPGRVHAAVAIVEHEDGKALIYASTYLANDVDGVETPRIASSKCQNQAPGCLVELDADTGKILRTYQYTAHLKSPPLVTESCIWVGTYDATLLCISLETFSVKKELKLGGNIPSSAVYLDGVILVATLAGEVACFDEETFEQKWHCELIGPVFGGLSVSSEQRRVYVSTAEGSVHCLSVDDGQEHWQAWVCGGPIFPAPTLDSEKLYVVCHDRYARALNSEDGTLIWETQVDAAIATQAAILDTSDLVVVTSTAGRVTALSKSDGTEQAWLELPAESFSSPAVVPGQNTIVLGARDDLVRAISISSERN